MRGFCAFALVIGLSAGAPLGAPDAMAQTPAPRQHADHLFREARTLLDQGRYAEACRLFERSLEIESSPGTLLNLGNCHEQSGDLVRALATFERAIAEAGLEPDPKKREAWVDAGTRRRDSLAARVPVLALSPSPTPGATVRLDDAILSHVGEPLRLAAGRHIVEVSAAERQTARREFTLAPGQTLALELPALEPLQPIPSEPAPAPATGERRPARRASAGPWVLIATGGALVATGVVTALLAKGKENQLERGCGPGPTCADPSLADVRDSGENLALASYLTWGIGGAGVAAGLIWLATEDRAPEGGTTELSAGCWRGSCGLSARGTF